MVEEVTEGEKQDLTKSSGQTRLVYIIEDICYVLYSLIVNNPFLVLNP